LEPSQAGRRLKGTVEALKEPTMDIPLLIAILALLTWTLLPQLDRYADGDFAVEGKPSRLQRLARWINN
jgi:hypothetical protein